MEKRTMFCKNCGQELMEGTAFCTKCGTSVNQGEPSMVWSEQPKTGDGKAIASLVCGIVSWIACGILFPVSIVGLVLGFLGLKSNRSGMATAGICLNASAFMLLSVAGMLIALLLPAVQAAREAARRMQCSNNEKQIALALDNYHNVHGALPPLYTVDDESKPLHSWRVLILPFIDQDYLYRQIRLDEPWDSDHNRQFHDQMPLIYTCPSNPDWTCCYSAIAGGCFAPAKEAGNVLGFKFADITKGTSNTLAIVEVKESFCWMDPTADVTLEDLVQYGVSSYHTGGANAALLDGSVRFINSISPDELRQLAMPGEQSSEKEM